MSATTPKTASVPGRRENGRGTGILPVVDHGRDAHATKTGRNWDGDLAVGAVARSRLRHAWRATSAGKQETGHNEYIGRFEATRTRCAGGHDNDSEE